MTVRTANLLVMSGEPSKAWAAASRLFPGVTLQPLRKADLKYGSILRRVSLLRSHRADLFVVYARDVPLLKLSVMPRLIVLAWLSRSRMLCLLDEHGQAWSCSVSRAFTVLLGRWIVEVPVGAVLLASLLGASPIFRFVSEKLRRRTPEGRSGCPDGRLRIGYLRSVASPAMTGLGGTASHTVGIVNAFADLDHRVHVISRPPAPEFSSGVRVSVIPFGRNVFTWHPLVEIENHLRFAIRAWRILRKDPPDALYQRHTRSDISGAIIARALRRPLLLEHEGSERLLAELWDPTPLPGVVASLEHVNHSAASVIFALSKEIRRDLIEVRGVRPEKIVLMPSGVDTARFRPGAADDGLRIRLGIPASVVVVGFCGTFGPWHGTDTLVRAIVALPPHPEFHFLFIGDGDGRAEAQTLLQIPSVTHGSTFTGLLPFRAMPAYLDACDVLVCPTAALQGGREFFGSPTKLFEYMAAGKPVIATRVGQIRDVIADEETGLLIEPGDAAGLGQALVRLGRDAGLRARLGQRAREEILAHYSWERNAQRVIGATAAFTARRTIVPA